MAWGKTPLSAETNHAVCDSARRKGRRRGGAGVVSQGEENTRIPEATPPISERTRHFSHKIFTFLHFVIDICR